MQTRSNQNHHLESVASHTGADEDITSANEDIQEIGTDSHEQQASTSPSPRNQAQDISVPASQLASSVSETPAPLNVVCESQEEPSAEKKRKLTSKVWDHFTKLEEGGVTKAQWSLFQPDKDYSASLDPLKLPVTASGSSPKKKPEKN
ncbi:hypothetical protein PCANC_18596 [Puccinia coronata f. sp. avenae]|uniref:Uncharacterized protein n=1 Tax=Puccinia coronata f. sp. avenae TaxID=200324 RepID=A0A2N5RXY0_9BASI|nr:hypothetical protein PCANC_25752 [Puccinia coronata f. sp. avenae]PLW26685.1 hypothetical protein PCANC_18596 [Puccinia coronata f. sp. avenae]